MEYPIPEDPEYRPSKELLSNQEVISTGVLCGGAVLNIAKELLESRKRIARLEHERKQLHEAIENFWVKQCEGACHCDEHPECIHTVNIVELRSKAIQLDKEQS